MPNNNILSFEMDISFQNEPFSTIQYDTRSSIVSILHEALTRLLVLDSKLGYTVLTLECSMRVAKSSWTARRPWQSTGDEGALDPPDVAIISIPRCIKVYPTLTGFSIT